MKATQTSHSTQLLKCNRWLKSWNPAKSLPNISNSTHLVFKVLTKSVSYGTIVPIYHPGRKNAVRNQTPVKAMNHSKPCSRNSQTNTNLIIEIQISVLDVVIPHMHKDLTAQLRSTNAKNAHPQPQQYHKGKPKHAHQIFVPEHSTKQYHNTCNCHNDDDFMIAFQLHAQPQKSVHNQR